MQSRYPLDWGAVEKMIGAAQPILELEARRLCDLVKKSNRLLRPLTEPLCTDFSANRFWRHSNEMAYSNWLAWIADQLGATDVIFRLFGLDGTDSEGRREGGVLKAEREHEIRGGRLDICITRGDCPIAVVEVKLERAERAELRSLGIYRKWAERKLGPSARGRLVLLAVDGERTDYDGFRLLRWRDLCLRLRNVSPSLIRHNRLTLAAIVLAFVGAVEQNLLGFPHDLVMRIVQKKKEKNLAGSSEIPDYLAEFTEGEPDGDPSGRN